MQAHYAVRPAQPHLVPVTGLGAGRCHRLSTRIGATTAARGKSFDPALLRIKKLLGQGSFGEVFEVRCLPWQRASLAHLAFLALQDNSAWLVQGTLGNEGGSRVVLKRVKKKVAVRCQQLKLEAQTRSLLNARSLSLYV